MAHLTRSKLIDTLQAASPAGAAWLAKQGEAARAAATPSDVGAAREALATAFSEAARRVGTASLVAARGTLPWPAQAARADVLARATLLLTAAELLPAAELVPFVEEAYRTGDALERETVLRSLVLLPEPARFLPMALDACRTHLQPVFESIACENPYPAEHFGDASFNQLVVKAMFTGVALTRIAGLETRLNADLSRMAHDYACERRAAQRPVPSDLHLLQPAAGERETT